MEETYKKKAWCALSMAGKPEEELSDEAEVSEGESNVCLGGSRQSRWAINVTELLMQMLQEVPLVFLCY